MTIKHNPDCGTEAEGLCCRECDGDLWTHIDISYDRDGMTTEEKLLVIEERLRHERNQLDLLRQRIVREHGSRQACDDEQHLIQDQQLATLEEQVKRAIDLPLRDFVKMISLAIVFAGLILIMFAGAEKLFKIAGLI